MFLILYLSFQNTMNTVSQCKGQTCLKSLFDLCIELVAESLDLVESFCGFPSLIGEKIFKTAVEYDVFSDYSKSSVALELFTEAFGAEIVSSLNLSQQHLGLNFFLEQFLLFSELVEIDLSFCGLGDHHEILAHIATMRRYISCADPESFVRGGPTLQLFFLMRGSKYHYKRATIGPPGIQCFPGVLMMA